MCKQHQAARAAERLVWLALILARSALLGAVAPGEWPDDLPFSDDACTAQRDRLALGWDTKAFREVLAAYLQLQAIATTPPAERGDTVLFWPALARHDDRFRRPLAERLEETPHRHRAGARGRPAPRQVGLFDDEAFKRSAGGTPVLRQRAGRLSLAAREGVGPVPPELRARAAEAIARQRHITDS